MSYLYSLKVSANAKIAMRCFENFRGGQMPPPGCAPGNPCARFWH